MQASSTEQAKNIAESERYIFRVFCYRAEAVSSFHLNCTSRKVYENKLLKVALNFLFVAFSGFLKIQETLPLMIVRFVCSFTELFAEKLRLSQLLCQESQRILAKTNFKRGEGRYVLQALYIFCHVIKKLVMCSFSSVPKSISLAQLCYNFGVDTYYREEYENCIGWLRQALYSGKLSPTNKSHQLSAVQTTPSHNNQLDPCLKEEYLTHLIIIRDGSSDKNQSCNVLKQTFLTLNCFLLRQSYDLRKESNPFGAKKEVCDYNYFLYERSTVNNGIFSACKSVIL